LAGINFTFTCPHHLDPDRLRSIQLKVQISLQKSKVKNKTPHPLIKEVKKQNKTKTTTLIFRYTNSFQILHPHVCKEKWPPLLRRPTQNSPPAIQGHGSMVSGPSRGSTVACWGTMAPLVWGAVKGKDWTEKVAAMYWVWPGSILPVRRRRRSWGIGDLLFFGWVGSIWLFLLFSVLTVKKVKKSSFFFLRCFHIALFFCLFLCVSPYSLEIARTEDLLFIFLCLSLQLFHH
jgi:hypothetical protein